MSATCDWGFNTTDAQKAAEHAHRHEDETMKAERLVEERAEEEYHEKRYEEKMKGAV